ncbi:Na+/H+ antiporter NhaC family protein [Massilibacteroides sp.]|uniref:Na+/H+ antiporter NhaC family protein n=1 Tax=Massilibacteroides sp. TaxID=2034766 RepID=UPI0026359F5E|nr:Na+/H+ antiporter NhaC family protein [Massilibacteroides sp.]MDD4514594.1 Na+/H+ antiporter NhaC family protein [Massilibacteroides sp.]
MTSSDFNPNRAPNPWALLPLGIFLISYLVVSIIAGDFYKMPISVAFVIASIVAIGISKGGKIANRMEQFCRGAGDSNIMLMVVIFVLAGAFAETTKATGAIDAAVNLTLSVIPGNLLVAGIFIAGCLISIAIGTSVGTIVALSPVIVGIATKTGIPTEMMLASVVGGAMFGDNLSFISDTTIIVTRTQGCDMSDKFKLNIRIVAPIAILTLLLYIFLGNEVREAYQPEVVEWVNVIPYLIVLVIAVLGVNVTFVLVIGIILSGITGLITGHIGLWDWTISMGKGITGMGELIIVTILAGGMLEMIRFNGGIDWLILKLTSHIHGRKGAETSMAAFTAFANFCTANNTIALIIAGPIAKNIATKFDVDPRRSASLIDIFSCAVQGFIPYGAQLLIASGLGEVSPLEIMPYLYYPYLLGVGGAFAILLGFPKTSKATI